MLHWNDRGPAPLAASARRHSASFQAALAQLEAVHELELTRARAVSTLPISPRRMVPHMPVMRSREGDRASVAVDESVSLSPKTVSEVPRTPPVAPCSPSPRTSAQGLRETTSPSVQSRDTASASKGVAESLAQRPSLQSRDSKAEDISSQMVLRDNASQVQYEGSVIQVGKRIFVMHNAWRNVDKALLAHYVKNSRPTRERMLAKGLTHNFSTNRLDNPLTWSEFLVFHPLSPQRLLWDLLTVFALLKDLAVVPLHIFKLPATEELRIVALVSAVFWTLDVPMSAITACEDGPQLLMQLQDIRQKYVRRWLLFDVSLVAMDWAVFAGTTHGVVFGLQLLRSFRLVRFKTLLRLVRSFKQELYSEQTHICLSMMQLLVEFMVAVHVITCGWYWLGESVAGGWVYDDHMVGKGILYAYWAASRWTIAQISGRTDLAPRTTPEYMYTCFACVFGIIAFSVIISAVTNTMIELTTIQRSKTENVRLLHGYMRRHNDISQSLTLRVKAHFQAETDEFQEAHQEQTVLKQLPKHVLMELMHEVRAPVLREYDFFRDLGLEFPRMLFRLVSEAVLPVLARPEEVLFHKGDACGRMLFVERGLLGYQGPPPKLRAETRTSIGDRPEMGNFRSLRGGAGEATHMSDGFRNFKMMWSRTSLGSLDSLVTDGQSVRRGMWLSEGALWIQWENHGTLTTTISSSLLSLEVRGFIAVALLFKDAVARASLYATKWVERLMDMEVLSDLPVAESEKGLWRTGTGALSLTSANESADSVELRA